MNNALFPEHSLMEERFDRNVERRIEYAAIEYVGRISGARQLHPYELICSDNYDLHENSWSLSHVCRIYRVTRYKKRVQAKVDDIRALQMLIRLTANSN
jgi:hypothetical protein